MTHVTARTSMTLQEEPIREARQWVNKQIIQHFRTAMRTINPSYSIAQDPRCARIVTVLNTQDRLSSSPVCQALKQMRTTRCVCLTTEVNHTRMLLDAHIAYRAQRKKRDPTTRCIRVELLATCDVRISTLHLPTPPSGMFSAPGPSGHVFRVVTIRQEAFRMVYGRLMQREPAQLHRRATAEGMAALFTSLPLLAQEVVLRLAQQWLRRNPPINITVEGTDSMAASHAA